MTDHPNIAKVLDAGTIGSEPRPLGSGPASPLPNGRGAEGRPYFVMELVKGIPFTKYMLFELLTGSPPFTGQQLVLHGLPAAGW
jgi:hypothetical protein